MNVKSYIQDSIDTKLKIQNDERFLHDINVIADVIVNAYRNNNKVITSGNGGSAADAQHIACEFVGKFLLDRPGLEAYALTTNSSILTAVGNDCGYEYIFKRQLQAISKKGDVFIAISTSGNSQNIVQALKYAKSNGVICVGLTGLMECEMDNYCDYILHVPSVKTPIIQESHIMIGHIICSIVENTIFNREE